MLERQTSFRDKVRGETLLCWGVAELQRLGLEGGAARRGRDVTQRGWWPYDKLLPPAHAEAAAAALDQVLPGVPGALDVGHPGGVRGAGHRGGRGRGATVVRGVGDVEVVAGAAPVVRYEHDDVGYEVGLRAGGRRRWADVHGPQAGRGSRWSRALPRTMGGGMLVDGLHDWPAGQMSLGTEGDLYYLLMPRAGGRVRLYLLHDIAQRGRFAGPGRERGVPGRLPAGLHPGQRDVRRRGARRAVRVLPDERQLDRRTGSCPGSC